MVFCLKKDKAEEFEMTTFNTKKLEAILNDLKIADAVRPLTVAELTKHWEIYSTNSKNHALTRVLNLFKYEYGIDTSNVQINELLEKLSEQNERIESAEKSAKELNIPIHWLENFRQNYTHETIPQDMYLMRFLDRFIKSAGIEVAIAFLLSFNPNTASKYLAVLTAGNSQSK